MNILINIKEILFSPYSFFQKVKKEKDIKLAVSHFLAVTFFGLFMLSFIFSGLFYKIFSHTWVTGLRFFPKLLLMWTLPFFLVTLLMSFVLSGVLHMFIKFLKGKGNYTQTYQLYVYAQTPSYLYGWLLVLLQVKSSVNFFNLISWIHVFILLLIGCQQIYAFPRWKSVLVVLFFLGVSVVSSNLLQSVFGIVMNIFNVSFF